MQKWQCVKEMQQLIRNASDKLDFCIFTRQPEEFWRKWKSKRPSEGLTVATRTPEELRTEYYKRQYGLMLRKDCVINRVACPTKLIEYLTYGIIPVMSTTNLGNFVADGMVYVTVQQLAQGQLPSEKERMQMVCKNLEVLSILNAKQQKGKQELKQLLGRQAH